MSEIDFADAFERLTGNPPFPWQRELYERFLSDRPDNIPESCNLPTGLGKTSVVAVWLIALAANPAKVPRRLVYVVNRRTVVDQTTNEVEKYRARLFGLPALHDRLCELCATQPTIPYRWEPLAISTLRGQFADNREWSADPSRPAVIAGTVDMIGSRLLFSGYGVGSKTKPLHAGFLGQDVLLVHDEAHLEPAFQELLTAIRKEQERCEEFGTFRVMELSATSRSGGNTLSLTDEDREQAEVRKRINAKKTIHLHELKEESKLADTITEHALAHLEKDSGRAVLVFVRKVDDVEKIATKLEKAKQRVKQLTGTLRGLERDELVDHPTFRRFLPKAESENKTVYLVCTSAGEVGVNISADHLVCDLSPFDSMAQRFGRVNRFGDRDDTRIDVVHSVKFDDKDEYDTRRKKTLDLLRELNADGSPAALDKLDPAARLAAFTPTPAMLPTSDILFDAWALTTIRDRLPGRPLVEPYLHGIAGWEPPETHVAWREEVGVITDDLLKKYEPADLLEDYPLKPHELLRDNSNRVFDRLKKLAAPAATPVWVMTDDDTVKPTTLGDLIEAGKDALAHKTVLLPPSAGGLENGMLTASSTAANDVADQWPGVDGRPRRIRVWEDDEQLDAKTKEKIKDMRLIRRIEVPAGDDEDAEESVWRWFERPASGDSDGSRSSQRPVLWSVHTEDVERNTAGIVAKLPLSDDLKHAIRLAAKFHDLGKQRNLFQRILGNANPDLLLAKSGKKQGQRLRETYRHEFGSLLDVLNKDEFKQLGDEMKELVLHLIAVHHGRGRPHFPAEEVFDPEPNGRDVSAAAAEVPRRFARLQRKYGRWGLAYLESLLRAADYAASANPSAFAEEGK